MQSIADFFASLLPHLIDYLVYLAIAIVTIIGVFKCLLPLWGTRRALRRAIRKLQDEAGTVTDHPVWQENLFLGRRLRGCWLRFLQNAIQLDRRGLPCNVEDYVNDDTVTHGPGNATLAELIPSLLTSLGILGTFMGMTQGLSGLDVTSTDQMMTGIQNLLNGMQFAFGTSVAGVSCSLIFNMLNRIAQGSSYRAIDDFTEAFTQLAMQRPLDNDVQLICQNQDRNHLLGNVSEAVTATLPQSMEKAVRSGMQPVSQAMSDFLRGATTAQIDGVARITGQFVDAMNRSLSDQFLALGRTMTEINVQQRTTMDTVQASLQSAESIMEHVHELHTVSSGIIDQFEHYIAELGEARKRDEGFEKLSGDLLNRMHAASQEQVQAIRTLRSAQDELASSIQSFSTAAQKTVKDMAGSGDRTAIALKDGGNELRQASETLSRSYETFVQNVVEGVSRSLGMFESSMSDAMEAFGKTSGQGDAQAYAEMQRTLSSIESILHTALEKTNDKES